MASTVRVLDVNFSVADIAKIFYPSLNGGESTDACGEVPPIVGPAPNDTSLPTTRSRVAKGKGKAATSTPPPSTSQKVAKKPSFLESEDDELDQLKISPKVKSGTPSGSGKPSTGRGKTGGSQAKPKDPLAPPKDKKRAHSPSPERTAPKPNKKSKKAVDISAPPPETSGIPKWGDPHLKLPGKWPKDQEGMVEQDPDNLVDSKPHIRDDVDPEVFEGAEGQPFHLWKDVSSTIALPSSIRASLALLVHGATAIRFSPLEVSSLYRVLREAPGVLNAFLEVAVQNGMTSQTMIEHLLTEIDFHWEQIFDLDQAILRLEHLKKKTIMAHKIAQDHPEGFLSGSPTNNSSSEDH
ncbi:hypothetical protein L218DRAFT_1005653 [Marasmius fiardii PR-910]|nr:hypothetical protein L218DRAFT_1005653 [Marasmius fiardii PR-910]